MRIGTHTIQPGEKKTLSIPISGGGALTVSVLCGARPGRTLVATAGVHGCEYPGIEALRLLSRTLDPADLRGQVILVPLVNPEGFYAGAKQVVPSDQVNLNQAFPGCASGTASARLAHAIETRLYPHADLLVDLHSGDIQEMAMPFVYFPAGAGSAVTAASKAAAAALSMPYRVASTSKNGLYGWAAHRGIPALLLERSGRGLPDSTAIEAYRQNILELLRYLQILPAVASPSIPQHELTETVYEQAAASGFWYPYVREGQSFPKDAVLGSLQSLDGRRLQTVTASFRGIVLYYTAVLGVASGDPLIAYGRLDSESL